MRIKVSRKKVKELRNRIKTCEEQKKNLVNYELELAVMHAKQDLSKVEYISHLEHFSHNRSINGWHDYYNNYMSKCEKEIRELHDEEFGHKHMFFSLAGSLLLVIMLFNLRPTITGFVVNETANSVNSFFIFVVGFLLTCMLYLKVRMMLMDIV